METRSCKNCVWWVGNDPQRKNCEFPLPPRIQQLFGALEAERGLQIGYRSMLDEVISTPPDHVCGGHTPE